MKNAIIAALTFSAGTFGIAGTAAAQKDCSSFSDRANFYTSIGLTDSASFWSSVATSCEAGNWADEDRSTVRTNIQTLAETAEYERPERETVQAAAEQAGVELPSRPKRGGGKGKGGRGGNNQ